MSSIRQCRWTCDRCGMEETTIISDSGHWGDLPADWKHMRTPGMTHVDTDLCGSCVSYFDWWWTTDEQDTRGRGRRTASRP